MPPTSRDRSIWTALAATALMFTTAGSLMWWLVLPAVGYSDDVLLVVRLVIVSLGGVVVPVILAVIGALAWRSPGRLRLVASTVVLALTAVAAQLTSLSFTAGFDEADAGRPRSGFSDAFPLFALGSLTLAALTLALVSLVLLDAWGITPRGRRAVRGLIAAGVAALGAIPLVGAIMSWPILVVAEIAVILTVTLTAPRVTAPVTTSRLGTRRVWQRAGVFAVSIVVTVWASGGAVGFALSGQPGATTAMGVSAALSSLAAIPLVVAAFAPIRLGDEAPGTRPRGRWWTALLPSVTIAISVAAQLVIDSPSGEVVIYSGLISGAMIGFAGATILIQDHSLAGTATLATILAMSAAGAVLWISMVSVSGGIVFGVAGIIAVAVSTAGGRRGRGLSRATSPASP